MSKTTKVAFVVQGEGRGHLSQALALSQMIKKWGFKLVSVHVGRSQQRSLPDYFLSQIGADVSEFKSPNFTLDKSNQGIQVGKSLLLGALNLPAYLNESRRLVSTIMSREPDVIVNFYEPLIGLSQILWRVKIPVLSIAHQYLTLHPAFKMPARPRFDRLGLKVLTRISQIGSSLKLALSFYPLESHGKIVVVPPLLRTEVMKLKPSNGDFYLIYVLNSGYADEIKYWHAHNSELEVHCFWDRFDLPNPYSPSPNLHFHHLSDTLFLDKMSKCKALITTAGFESVCEALFLGKPVAMVPVKGHYEQKLNSYDALNANAGIRNDEFIMDELFEKLHGFKRNPNNQNIIRSWFLGTEEKFKAVFAEVLSK